MTSALRGLQYTFHIGPDGVSGKSFDFVVGVSRFHTVWARSGHY